MAEQSDRESDHYDLCVIGAGIAGLNALYVASEYLPKGARVVLIDRNKATGGMWNDTYDFVRMHQPHEMFTTGDVPWEMEKPREYLASGNEVLDHLKHCTDVIRNSLDLTELFEHDVTDIVEVASDAGAHVMVTYRSLEAPGAPRKMVAKQVVQAFGLDVPVPPPLDLNSDQVLSTSPHLLHGDLDMQGDEPVYVIGGGKTGMDTVLEVAAHNPQRKICLINGRGTVFANRDMFLPSGNKRWWHGQPVLKTLRDVSTRFDGTNADEIFDYFREIYALSPDGRGDRFVFAYMSEEENAKLAESLDEIVYGYLEDVVDGEFGPEIVMRNGTHMPIEKGAIIVNCTGHVMRTSQHLDPVLSSHGAILTISSRAAIHFLTSVSSYFLSHLFFSGKLRNTPLYSLDMDDLFKKDGKVWAMAVTSLGFLNTLTLMNTLPMKVMERCGLDLDRWYPMVRRVGSLLDVKMNHKRYAAHCRQSLDRIAEDYGVRCQEISVA